MQKFARRPKEPAHNDWSGFETKTSVAPIRRLLKQGQLATQRTRIATGVGGLVLIGLVAWFNLQTARGLNFEVLYLLLCAFVGWFAGAIPALLCGLVSVFLPWFAGVPVEPHNGFFYINLLLDLLMFLGIGWLAGKAGKLTRHLDSTGRQRTAHLEKEVTEHKETAELLHEAVELFEQFTGNVTDVFWVTDATRVKFEFVSPAFEGLWGDACETLYESPQTWLQRIHTDDRDRVNLALATKQTMGTYDEEYRILRPDGAIRWIHDRAFPVRDDAGVVYRMVGIAEDITDRKRHEQVTEAHRDLAFALGSTTDLNFAVECLLNVATGWDGIDCGGVYLQHAGSGELELKRHRGFSDPFVERVSRFKADSPEARLLTVVEPVYLRHDQIPRNLEVFWGREGLRSLALVPIGFRGQRVGLLCLGSYRQDEISPRTRAGIEYVASEVAGTIARITAEELLRQSESKLRTTITNAPVALLSMDAAGNITFEEGKALSAMGVSPGEHVGQSALKLYDEFPLMQENVRRALEGETFSCVVEFTPVTFECQFCPLTTGAGERSGFIVVGTDVTERVRLEREVLEITDREQARIGQDIHDGLCQQLIGMAFSANALLQALNSQGRTEASTAAKITTLLDEAITESRRVCRGLYPIRLSTDGLGVALQDLATTTSDRYNIRCECNADISASRYEMAVATHLYRIAQEAVNNAVKHARGSAIVISLLNTDSTTVLEVRDFGSGSDVAPSPGSGMGLHIMSYRARLLGGNLTFKNDAAGATVTCSMPKV